MRLLRSFRVSRLILWVGMATLLLLAGCGRGRHRVLEVAYVSAPQAALRDQVAAIFNRVGNVKNGERVEVLDREKRFARVRTSTGIEGWIEQRFLVDQKTFDALQKLTADNQNDPVQAPGVLRNDTNLHVTPGRDSEHLYQLASGAKVSILKRETAEKQTGAVPAAKATAKTRSQGAGRAYSRRLVAGTRQPWAASVGCSRAWSISTFHSTLPNTPRDNGSSRFSL